MTNYINPLHHHGNSMYGPNQYSTDAKPKSYKGYLIYERIEGVCFDVVLNGTCVTQRAGINGARRAIDELTHGA